MSRRGFVKFANRPGKTPGFRASQARAATGLQRANVRAAARSMMAANRATASSFRRAAAILTKKGVDTDLSLSPIINTVNTNGSCFCVNLVQAGSGSWNRTGRKILNRSLVITGFLGWTMGPSATGALYSNFVRMVVVYDKQTSGAIVPFSTVFGITDQSGTESTPDVLNPPKYDNMDRFRVLADRRIMPGSLVISTQDATHPTPQQTTYTMVNEFIDLKGIETVFSGQSVPMTAADIASGSIAVYFRSVFILFLFSYFYCFRSTILPEKSLLASMASLVFAMIIKHWVQGPDDHEGTSYVDWTGTFRLRFLG